MASNIVIVSGSPTASSRTLLLAREVGQRLASAGFGVELINVRDLPAEDLLFARAESPAIADALRRVDRAAALVVATPIYKAASSGLLKIFLDLLPQFGLAGKTVLPLATGGSAAHVLAIDYALRPVLASLGARHVVPGCFVLDKQIERREAEGVHIDPLAEERLGPVLQEFMASVRAQGDAARVVGARPAVAVAPAVTQQPLLPAEQRSAAFAACETCRARHASC